MTREEQLARQRAYYAKHREKRLAAKRAEYAASPDKLQERNRRQYAKHKEDRVAYARQYRRENKAAVNARAKERYAENRDVINERRKGYKPRPEVELLSTAKMLIMQSTGMRYAEIPKELAEAKAAQLQILRWARDQKG